MGNIFDLTGKNVVITGSSRGIGKSIAMEMAKHGANVVISSRKIKDCEETAAEINALDCGKAITKTCNISSKEEIKELIESTTSRLGSVDVLVCNAASNPYFGSLMNIPDDAFDKIMANNVRSNIWLSNFVLPQMRERKDGRIILISSVAALKGSAMLGAYAISKAADVSLVKSMAIEQGSHNVTVNAICPGLVRTDFARALWENPEILKQTTSTTPLKRIGEPIEIAGSAVYLASKAGSFTTGEFIVVDGGATIA